VGLGLSGASFAVVLAAIGRMVSEEKQEKMPPVKKIWRAWWEKVGEKYEFVDRDEEARKLKKYGYAVTRKGVYEGMDVIVLQSRGDSIEQLLGKMEISHRMTRAGQIPKDGLHPFALFVSNCTGEITNKDVEYLQWFVRAGGYLFCSCWALTHTAEKVYPGLDGYDPVVKKVPSKGNVLDNVPAEPAPRRAPTWKASSRRSRDRSTSSTALT